MVLLLVPKAAASSIRRAVGLLDAQNRVVKSKHAKLVHSGIPARAYKYHRIAIVRNTWDRMVSCWYQKTHTEEFRVKHLSAGFRYGMPFDEFVDRVADDIRANHHFYPQNEIVSGYHTFWTTAELADVWPSHYGDLEVLNAAPRQHYSRYYNTRTASLVRTLYGTEIDEFGFTFEGG